MKYRGAFKNIGWDKLRQKRYENLIEMGLIDSDWALPDRPDYIPAWDSLHPAQKDFEDLRMAAYAAMIDVLDRNIKRLVQHLKAKGEWDNTLLLFCSDNGACPFDRTYYKHQKPWEADSFLCYDPAWANASNTPFRWYKRNQHEGGIASPMIAHWPNGLNAEAGSFIRQPSHLIDILPTLVDVAQADDPQSFDRRPTPELPGQSLLPLLKGNPDNWPGRDWLYFVYEQNRAIRQGDWKLVSERGGRWQLYNMAEDRTETNNLAADKPKRTQQLKQLWHRVAEEVDRAPQRVRQPVADKPPQFNLDWLTPRQDPRW
jgi:arylsulfatase